MVCQPVVPWIDSTDWTPSGWWLVKRGDEEGWAPHNYLELVPPKPKAAPAPPPPARRPVPTPASVTSNGSTTKPAVPSATRAGAAKPKPPIATGNKPVLALKPAVGGGKPPVPNATRPPATNPKPAASGGAKGGAPALGQMDLAAAVS